ncbi:TetR/AcrR family transcriptional regulator [Bacillus methanolicus]|uniref:Transcriptional regulator, TetR family protein n=1 Tax=Bacillus methanolicus (strain MGA3 / ATCC 53907) TaxID=796606 RepID=I3EBR9_BACMM|nr:TetR/AcrR family transcriptional regulator [Bacillus methanolicus]AIE61621.1 transcriptional regulator, TetR family protein [Bacillus methanolicus MGA3]EIJ83940.1 transcriptional regulator, TetR family protein [Bacillus methanolicus MGA3]
MYNRDFIMEELFEDEEGLTEKQKKIIIAAIESFSEKGYAATSTSEIAKKAGVAEGTIFRHYKTKKDLLVSIVAPMIAKFIAPFVIKDLYKVLDQQFERFEDFLKAMIENRAEFLKNNLPMFKIFIQEIPFHPELKALFKEHIVNKVYERFSELIKHYQDRGQIIELPAYSIVRLVVSSIFGYLFGRYLLFPEADWDDEAEIERTIDFIMHGLKPKN